MCQDLSSDAHKEELFFFVSVYVCVCLCVCVTYLRSSLARG